MKTLCTALISACLALAAGAAGAAAHTDKEKAAMAKKEMTMQECKDHMAMAKKDGTKKDDAMMKKDTMCAEMMKKDAAAKPDPMKK